MIKSTKQKLLLTIKVTFLCLSLSLLPTNKGVAQVCNTSNIDSQITNLHNPAESLTTIAALKQCGSLGVSALITALQHEDDEVRIHATLALGNMGAAAKNAIPALATTLYDKNEKVRASAASALGDMGIEAEVVLPILTKTLRDSNQEVRSSAGSALKKIVASVKNHRDIRSTSRLDKAIPDLEIALKVLKVSEAKLEEEARVFVRPPFSIFQAKEKSLILEQTLQLNWQQQLIVSMGIYIISLSSLWLVIFWLRPLWLLRINNTLKHYTDFTLPRWLGSFKVPLRYVLLVGFFHRHSRVLDAWVDAHTGIVREGLEKKAHQHKIVSVISDSSNIAKLIKPNNFNIPEYAKAIAWECLKQNYQPASINRQDALTVIAAIDGTYRAEAYLQHLEEHLGIIQTVNPIQDKICFVYPLLAEYLAASYIVKLCGDNETKWHEFLAPVDIMPSEAIKGFLLAVWDCCLSLGDAVNIPSFVIEKLSIQAALSTETTRQTQVLQHH